MKELTPTARPSAEPVSRLSPDYADWLEAGISRRRPLTEAEKWAGNIGALSSDPDPYTQGAITR